MSLSSPSIIPTAHTDVARNETKEKNIKEFLKQYLTLFSLFDLFYLKKKNSCQGKRITDEGDEEKKNEYVVAENGKCEYTKQHTGHCGAHDEYVCLITSTMNCWLLEWVLLLHCPILWYAPSLFVEITSAPRDCVHDILCFFIYWRFISFSTFTHRFTILNKTRYSFVLIFFPRCVIIEWNIFFVENSNVHCVRGLRPVRHLKGETWKLHQSTQLAIARVEQSGKSISI